MSSTTPDVFTSVLGKVVLQLRKHQGLSQTEFAEKIGITQSSLSRIEQGVVTPDAVVFRRIAQQAEMSTDYFYRLIDDASGKAEVLASAAGGKSKRAGGDWWTDALATLGAFGVGALIGVAVAALLEGDRRDE